jgi:hypothetical protein
MFVWFYIQCWSGKGEKGSLTKSVSSIGFMDFAKVPFREGMLSQGITNLNFNNSDCLGMNEHI